VGGIKGVGGCGGGIKGVGDCGGGIKGVGGCGGGIKGVPPLRWKFDQRTVSFKT